MHHELKGKVFLYDLERDLKAYSNGIESDTKIVFIGGLGCNLHIGPFTASLSRYCSDRSYEFIMPQLRSQPNFGLFTIEDDVEDLEKLLKPMNGDVVLIGNSTGCQDIVCYLNRTGKGNVRLAILQGAVSDVEYEEHINKDLNDLLTEVRGMEPSIAFQYRGSYITPQRFLDLFSRNGKEDMFSSYLEDEAFRSLNTTGVHMLFVISGKDEYGVIDIESKLKLVRNSKVRRISNGTHVLMNQEDIQAFLRFCDQEITNSLRKN